MAFEFFKKLIGKLTRQKVSRPRNFGELWMEFTLTNFLNGTLVEYASTQEGHNYREVETVRDAIRDHASSPNKVCLLTLEKQYPLSLPLRDIKKEADVFYLDPVYSDRNYAVAPMGIKIPEKPSLEEVARQNDL